MKFLRFIALAAIAVPIVSSADADVRRKVIGYGWDLLAATPDILLRNAAKIGSSGVDGVFTGIRFTSGGRCHSSQTIATDGKWPREILENKFLPVLKKFPGHPGLKESLIGAWFMPQKRLRWDDDAAWGVFAGNMGEIARLASKSGLKGLFLDTEDYAHQGQFVFRAGTDGASYGDAAALARRRGREMASAVFGEHPSAVLLATWFLSVRQGYATATGPVAPEFSGGDLWPAFLNGMLEAAPPEARFVDGCENGYGLDAAANEFHLEATWMRRGIDRLVTPENRRKFRKPFASGFGLYLDMYVNGPESTYHFGPAKDGSRLTTLRNNLEQAFECSTSGYVWIYGERHTFVEWSGVPDGHVAFQKRWADKLRGGTGTWEEKLPGLGDALRYVKDRRGAVLDLIAKMKREGDLVNLLGNGHCRNVGPDGLPKGFWTWTAHGSPKDVFVSDLREGYGDSSCISVCGLANGVVGTDVAVKGGEMLYGSFRVKGVGGGGSLAFKRKGGFVWKWPRAVAVFGKADASGWRKGEVFARVPEGADKATFMASASLGEGQKLKLDDFVLYRLPR